MAGTSLGALFVELIFKDAEFGKGIAKAQKNLKSFGADVTSLTDGIAGKFTMAITAATAAITGLAAASAVVGAEFEQKITKVAVIAGESVDELAAAARRMGANTKFSAIEAADAMESLAQAGFLAADIIGGTEAALALAAASGAELAQATQITAATMAQFNLGASDAGRIADVFTQALNSSLLNMQDLTVAMSYAGTVGATFGMSLEETTAAVAMFSNLGLEGSKAGTAFRMSMSQAATVSKKAAVILEDLGLSAADISPEFHTFGEISETVGKSGMNASQGMVVFGTEVGGNVIALAQQSQDAGVAFEKTFDGITKALQESEGKADDSAKAMTATVMGAFEELSGSFEEVLLTLYDQYSGPLRALLLELGSLIDEVGAQFKFASGQISDGFSDVLGGITTWIAENRTEFATMIVMWTQNLIEVGRVLAMIIPHLDTILKAMAAIWAVNKLVNFVLFLGQAYQALLLVQGAVAALAAELAVTTGGIYLIVAAIGLAVAALATYVLSNDKAAESANRLTEAQKKQKLMNDALLQKEASAMDARLVAIQEAARQELDSSALLSRERRKELNEIIELDGASAALAVRQGKLVDVNGELRTAASLVSDAHESQTMEIDAASKRAAELATEEAALIEQQNRLRFAVDHVSEGLKVAFYQPGEGHVSMLAEEARVELDELGKKIEVTRKASNRLKNDVALAERALADEAAEATRGLKSAAGMAELGEGGGDDSAAKAREAARKAAHDANAKLYQDALDQAAKAGKDQTAVLRLALEQQIRDVAAKFDEEAALTDGSTAEVEARKQATIGAMRAEFAADETQRFAQSAEEEKKSAAERLTTVAELTAETTRLHEEAFQAQMEGQGRWVAYFKFLLDDALGNLPAGFRIAFAQVSRTVVDFGEVAAKAIRSVGDTMSSVVSKMTGFSFSISSLMSGIQSAQASAVSEATSAAEAAARDAGLDDAGVTAAGVTAGEKAAAGFDWGAAAGDFVQGLFEHAAEMAQALVAALPPALTALAEGIPGLLQVVIDEFPKVIQALVDGIPKIIFAVVDALPDLFRAILDGMIALLGMLLGMLPDLLTQLLSETLPDILGQLAEKLPVMISMIVEALPGIIQAIVDSLPVLLDALIEMVAPLFVAIVGAIPDIMVAIVGAIPEIVYALILAIPTVIMEVIKTFPMLLAAFIHDLPKIIAAFVSFIPELANEVIMGLVDGAKKFADALLEFLTGGLSGLFKKGNDADPGTANAIVSAVSDAFSGMGGGASAYSGVEYVPATMRMTVHKGERVVPADRNAHGVGGPSPSTAGFAQAFPTGSGGGSGSPVELSVLVDGQVVDGAVVSSMGKGRAPKLQRMIRQAGGVRVGFDRGRYSPWSK